MDAVLKTTADQNHYYRFPVLNLLRIPRIAFDVRKLILAIFALALMHYGHQVIDEIFGDSVEGERLQYLSPLPYPNDQAKSPQTPSFTNPYLMAPSAGAISSVRNTILSPWEAVLFPWESVYEPTRQIAMGGNSWNRLVYLWSHLAWSLGIWAFLGLGICRLAAMEFVTDTRASLRDSAVFGFKNGKAIFVAFQIALFTGLVIWLMLLGLSLADLLKFNNNGDSLATLLWFIPWVCALPLALLLIGSLAGWPLSLATVAVEGSDGFDAFSRPFSYVFSKPLRYFLYWFIAAFVLVVVAWVFEQFVQLVQSLAQSHVLTEKLSPRDAVAITTGKETGRQMLDFWIEALIWLQAAFRISLFFTAGTVVYFLMRRADDAIALSEIYIPPTDDAASKPPLSGVAATAHPQPGHDAPVVPQDEPATESADSAQSETTPPPEPQADTPSEESDK